MQLVDPDRYASLKATGKLPSPKGVALSIIRLLQREDFRVADLVQLVQSDPAIAGRLLYFANAAAFGRSRPIVSLQRAIVALGSFRVRDLVIGLSVMYNHRNGQCVAFDYEKFWAHSLASGIACQELAQFAQVPSEEIFTLGLLARIGELALASLFPEAYSDVILAAGKERELLTSFEKHQFSMTRLELGATLLTEWGLPETLIQAAYYQESPDEGGFADGSRVLIVTHTLSFASALAQLCLVDEESRWGLLPTLLARAARLGISGDMLNELVDRTVVRWREWGTKLQVRTQEVPPFAKIVAATPSLRHLGTASDSEGRSPSLSVQLIGLPTSELPSITRQIEQLGHRPEIVEDAAAALQKVVTHLADVVIANLRLQAQDPVAFCRALRQLPEGKECHVLLVASPQDESRTLEAIDAGADDVLIRPLNEQTLRVHLNTASRLRVLRDEIHRERMGILRSTDEFAAAQKRLLQDALTDTLTQLPNRRHGLDFLASEWTFAQSSGAALACLMLDIDHFKRINDTYGHAAGDAVLRQLAEILMNASRAEDMVFRYGGEEFVAVLTNASLRVATQIGERIRTIVERATFLWDNQRIPVTLSIGAAVSAGSDTDSHALIQAADSALYQAKESGRNRVVAARPDGD